jgi:predicted PurR-regulated permease PerM
MAQGDPLGSRKEPEELKTRVAFVPALMLLAIFLYVIADIWHPLVVAGTLGFFLWPVRQTRWVNRLLYTILGLASLWLLWQLRGILAPLLIALALAYVFKPVVEWLCGNTGRWRPLRLGRTPASLVVTVALFGFLGFLGAEIGSLVVSQSEELARLTVDAGESIRTAIPASWPESGLLSQAVEEVAAAVDEFVSEIPHLSRELDRGVRYAAAGALGLLMTVIIFFYAVRDFNRLLYDFSQRILPSRLRSFAESRVGEHSVTVRKFLGGYFITSSVVFVLTLILLLAFGIRLAVLLALLAAVLNIIPVIGFWVSTAVTLVVALSTGVPPGTVLLLGLGMAAINVFEGNFLQPKVIGDRIGLHPVAVILSVAVFGKLLGVAGVLLGVPLAAIATTEWEKFRVRLDSEERAGEGGSEGEGSGPPPP